MKQEHNPQDWRTFTGAIIMLLGLIATIITAFISIKGALFIAVFCLGMGVMFGITLTDWSTLTKGRIQK